MIDEQITKCLKYQWKNKLYQLLMGSQ